MTDWRLTNQEEYLKRVALVWRPYSPASPDNDHDHCEFCFAKFIMDGGEPDALREGYATPDKSRWVCKTCFNDFRDFFEWHV